MILLYFYLKAGKLPEYKHLVEDAVKFASKETNNAEERMNLLLDKLAVNFGCEILKIIPGRVSTEVDARVSFNKDLLIERARRIIKLYEEQGISRERVLIKLASNWEGCEACKVLEREGIHCNMTLIFCLPQAVAAAEAGATLISPFVGRILDWTLKTKGLKSLPAVEDPGVHSVQTIYNYFKKYGYKTSVMGASFRNTGEIIELCGCDLLTVSPQLLDELTSMKIEVKEKLNAEKAKEMEIEKIELNEASFRWMLNEDQMATEKLSEGLIYLFK